jgi:hypothetical protein
VTCAIDGTILYGADSWANRARLPKHRSVRGEPGYPRVRLLVLVACGTRPVIGAVLGTDKVGERVYAEGLLGHLHAGMIPPIEPAARRDGRAPRARGDDPNSSTASRRWLLASVSVGHQGWGRDDQPAADNR